jgi:translation elongation factor aEF-1 beta
MGNAIITFELMGESPDVNLEPVKEQALKIAEEEGSKGDMIANIEPVAFGLNKVVLMAMFAVTDTMDFDAIAERMSKIEGVNDAKVAKMDLAMG